MPPEPSHQRSGTRLPLLLRVPEAASELRISARRVYDLAGLGILDLVKIGKLTRITSASVRRLARQRGKTDVIKGLQQYRGAKEGDETEQTQES